MTSVTFIIVTYNGEYWIKKCLDSAIEAAPNSTVILVDNNSTDQTLKIAQQYDQVKIIALKENKGFGAANNIGLESIDYEKCDFVVLLNQDAYIESSAIKNFQRDVQSSFGIHAFLQMNGVGDDYDPHFKFDYLKADKCPGFLEDVSKNEIRSYYPIHQTSAACWLLPKSTIMKIGGFSPTFYHYGEDDNYIDRLHYHGLQVALYPKCKVYHDRTASKEREFYREKKRKELRYWMTHLSNPKRTESKPRILVSLFKELIFSCIYLNGYAFSISLEKISLLFQLSIVENRRITQEQGPSFLHFNKPHFSQKNQANRSDSETDSESNVDRGFQKDSRTIVSVSLMEKLRTGVVFCAGGNAKYIDEARFAARSVKSHMPQLPIALFSDQEVAKGSEFNYVFQSKDYDHPQKLKMHGMLNSPFERSLYLDSDTLTKGDFSELFQFLDFYDIGVTHRVKCQWPPNATPIFLDYVDHDCIQGGFLLFKKSAVARAFIQDWADEFFQTPGHLIRPGTEFGDQIVMNRVWKKHIQNPNLKALLLPNKIYNARPWMWSQLKTDGLWSQTKILHAHGLNTPAHMKFIKKIKHRLGIN